MIEAELTHIPDEGQLARVSEVKAYLGDTDIRDGDDELWILGEELRVVITDGDDGEEVVVPVGFTTDGASVPGFAQVLTGWKPFERPQRWAGVTHDWLYCQPGYERKRADRVFRAVLVAEAAGWFRHTVMYLAVRWFGADAYRRNQRWGPDAKIFRA